MAGNALTVISTGLEGVETAMQAVADNLANSQTTGFESESVDFSTLLGEFVAGNALGGGVTSTGITRDLSEGAITQTNSPTDMAIQGNGYFVLDNASGSQDYTRDGQTQVSASGQLVGFNGESVMGYAVNAAGVPSGVLGSIAIPQGVLAPTASTQNSIAGNLVLTYYYQNAGPGAAPAAENWNWSATLDGSAVGLANNSGTVGFDTTGAIVSGATPALPMTATIAGAANLSLNLDFSGLTQYAGGTAASGTADGNAVGNPQGVQIGSNGTVSVSYSNGQTVNVAQVALATFPSEQGLQLTNGVFTATSASGVATVSAPGSGAAGTIQSNALEGSNVDTTNELVNLVVLQNTYQANAKALQTQDAILGSILQIQTQ
jgi:flagellar hook protein FlgE